MYRRRCNQGLTQQLPPMPQVTLPAVSALQQLVIILHLSPQQAGTAGLLVVEGAVAVAGAVSAA